LIAVHACWTGGALRLWGETSRSETAAVPPRTRGRKSLPHPFAADAAALAAALGGIGGAAASGAAGTLRLRLPSAGGAPLASPHAGGAGAADGADVTEWAVPSIDLPPGAALDLLLALPETSADGVIIAETLRGMGETAKLALELVARGRVVPTLPAGGRAVWLPLLSDPADAERMAALRRALPAACFAAADPPDDAAAAPDDALEALVDACIREALRGASLLPRRPGRRPAAEGWVQDLLAAPDEGPAAATDPVRRAVAGWTQPLAAPTSGGLRTCFRLVAPDAGAPAPRRRAAAAAPWRLEFMLQAADDPSLQVPAEQVWSTPGPLTVFRRTVQEPQERLLADLGRAVRLFPPLQPALRGARPTGCDLDAETAHRFLREGSPLLSQAGLGVQVPGWWGRPAARVGLKLRATPASTSSASADGRLGLEALCDYRWEVSLGGETIPEEEFRALASAKVPLVQHRGEWVELRQEEVEAALRMFARGASGQMSAAEVLRLAHGAEEEATALPVVGVEAGGWLARLLDGDGDARIRPAAAPAGFAGTLRPYQRRGLSWLAYLEGLGLGACLADDMGLGKTVQLLALLLARRPPAGRRRRPPPTLLVCPMSLVGNWQREAERFAPELAVHVHHGGERLSGPALRRAVRGSDLVITTYALAARDREELAAVDWARVVLDEAQNVKNPAARQTQAVKSFRAPSRIALTGTPVENRLSELWSILDFLNPGLLGTAAAFRRTFATPIERYRDAGRAEALQRVTRPFILRRLKTDRRIVRDLPAKQEMKVYCNLTREQASLYQATVDEMLEQIAESEGIGRKGLVLSTLLRLKQVCNHPAQFLGDGSALDGRSGKLARLQEVLEEVAAVGDRALVFTQFREMGTLLQRHLEPRLGFDVPFLHGGTPRAARDEMVARFQGEGGPPVFLLSLKAGGTGLNLTAANQVIHFDRWWNPAVEDQATDRAFRIGQRRDVQVRKLVCAGTLEERIDEIIEGKKQLAASVLGTGEAWLTELSTAELRRIVALSADAVAE
jgi:hypothetical protein